MEAEMGLHNEYSENQFVTEEEIENISQKRDVRKKIEDYMERKRLKEELEDELDADFNWDDYQY